jgi:hypothetical protein
MVYVEFLDDQEPVTDMHVLPCNRTSAALSAAAMQSLVVERGHIDCEFAGYGLDLGRS